MAILSRRIAFKDFALIDPITSPNSPRHLHQVEAGLDQSGEIDAGRMLRQIWRGKFVFTVTMPLGMAAAVALMWILPVNYTAQMVVSPGVSLASKSGDGAGLGTGLLGVLGGASGNETATPFAQFQELLKSPETAKRLDMKHGLLRILYATAWDAQRSAWKMPTGPVATLKSWIKSAVNAPTSATPSYQTLADRLSKMVTVSQNGRSSLWTIAAKAEDPVLAKDLLVWLHDEADDIVRSVAIQRTQANIDYLISTLPSVTANEQRTALTDLLVQQEINMMMLRSKNAYSAEVLVAPEIPQSPSSPRLLLIFGVCLTGAFFWGCLWAAHRGKTSAKV